MICHKTKCLFIHVPKVAGKSVLSLFGLPLLGRDYNGSLPWIREPYGHARIVNYRRQPWFKDYFKFAFVRNPFDRLVSAFFYLNGGGINEWDRNFADAHLQIYDGDFQRFVLEGLDSVIDHTHFKPQIDWICEPGDDEPMVDFLGRFEELEKANGSSFHSQISHTSILLKEKTGLGTTAKQ